MNEVLLGYISLNSFPLCDFLFLSSIYLWTLPDVMMLSKNILYCLEQPRKFLGRFLLCVHTHIYFPFCIC